MMYQIINGDARRLPLGGEMFDSCVTDPPYELGFMGKSWDKSGVANDPATWREVLRVLKPGAHLLAFSGTRTYHRMVCAIEDAGFEIRDQIQWIYGSGFPKSLDISKAVDKGKRRDYVLAAVALGMTIPGNSLHDWVKAEHAPSDKWWQEFKNHLLPEQWAQIERTVIGSDDKGKAIFGSCNGEYKITTSASDEAKQWNGWGTALKPANEPICLARKPLEKGLTVAQNVLKWGTGALNIDASRIEGASWNRPSTGKDGYSYQASDFRMRDVDKAAHELGRFPTNVIHDGSEEVLAGFPVSEANGYRKNPSTVDLSDAVIGYSGGAVRGERGHNDIGSAARFFYCAKASNRDREAGLREAARPTMGNGIGAQPNQQVERYRNSHPTVKPTDLMRYLCRLVTPPEGLILDPFCGSGSTIKAALIERFNSIGVELNEEYVRIANGRMNELQVNLF